MNFQTPNFRRRDLFSKEKKCVWEFPRLFFFFVCRRLLAYHRKNSKTLKWPIFCFAPETRIIVDKSKKTKVQEGEDGYGTMYNEKKTLTTCFSSFFFASPSLIINNVDFT